MKHDNCIFTTKDGAIKVVNHKEAAKIILAMRDGEYEGCSLTDHNNSLEVEIVTLRIQSKIGD